MAFSFAPRDSHASQSAWTSKPITPGGTAQPQAGSGNLVATRSLATGGCAPRPQFPSLEDPAKQNSLLPFPNSFNPGFETRGWLDSAPRYGDSSFTVRVGPPEEATSFSIHEDMARRESGFLDAAFRNEWKESKQRVVDLPDHEAEHFQLFFLWLYHGRIYSARDEFSKIIDPEWDRLAHAWTLGAYLQSRGFKNAVCDAMIEKATGGPPFGPSVPEIIYRNTDTSAPIRRLVVDIATTRWTKSMMMCNTHDGASSEFYYDLSISLMGIRQTDTSIMMPWAKGCGNVYHEWVPEDCRDAPESRADQE